jgi:hypothetical protein
MFEKLGLVMVVSESRMRISLIDERLRMPQRLNFDGHAAKKTLSFSIKHPWLAKASAQKFASR